MAHTNPKRDKDATQVPAQAPIAGAAPEVGPFADIDAEEFEAARSDPKVKRFAELADRQVAALREQGRLD